MSQTQQQKMQAGHGWPKTNDPKQASMMKLPVSQSLTLNRTINL